MVFYALKEASLYPLLRKANALREKELHKQATEHYKTIIKKLEKQKKIKTSYGHYILAQSYKFSAGGLSHTMAEFKNAYQKSPRVTYLTHYLTAQFNLKGCAAKTLKSHLDSYLQLDVKKKANIRALNKYLIYLLHAGCYEEARKIKLKLGSKLHAKDVLAVKVDNITKTPEYKALDNYSKYEKYILKNKGSICVVGNSANNLGSDNGEKIDSHKVVIRINNFSTEKKFSKDYGTRTNIWVRGGNKRIKERPKAKFDFVLYSIPNIFHTSFDWNSLPKKQKTSIFPQELVYELTKILDAPPSSGMLTLYSLYKILGPLKRSSLFGFAFTDHIEKDVSAHYFEDFKVSMSHAWNKEKALFAKITKA